MAIPNYKEYSLAELKDALAKIDREKFPARTKLLIHEIESRTGPLPDKNSDKAPEPASDPDAHLPEYREDRHPNFFIRYWKGQVSLPVSYWLVGFAVGILFFVLTMVIDSGVESATSSQQLGAYILCLYITLVVAMVWQSVGVYRSATRHPLRGGSKGWATTAKVMVVISAISFGNEMLTSGFPIIKSGFQMLSGTEQYPETHFRILNKGTEMEIFGGLDVGAELELQEHLEQNPDVRILHLHSIGGRILAAKRMMKIIQDYELDTFVRTECVSACTLLFLAGKNRFLGTEARLKFHAASIGGVSGHDVKEIGVALENAYLEAGVPGWFVEKAAKTPGNEFWVPTNEELLEAGVVNEIVEPGLYAYSGIGTEADIRTEDIEAGLLSYQHIVAMKDHDPQTYRQIVELNLSGMKQGLPLTEMQRQFTDLLYSVRLPVYLSRASNEALVKYWKGQIHMMKELQDSFPLACASFVYPDEVPEARHYGNEGTISAQAQAIESEALVGLISTFNDDHRSMDEQANESLIEGIVVKIKERDEVYYDVISSPESFVDQPDLLCEVAIAVNEAFIDFDVDTSGQLLRSLNQ